LKLQKASKTQHPNLPDFKQCITCLKGHPQHEFEPCMTAIDCHKVDARAD
ncbi:unnamed protein product, partial [Staurois parvus]